MIILDNKRHVKTYSHNDVHSAIKLVDMRLWALFLFLPSNLPSIKFWLCCLGTPVNFSHSN